MRAPSSIPAASGSETSTVGTATVEPTRDPPASAPTTSSSEATTPPRPKPPADAIVIAWQPSHQNDTGHDWHEYVVCGDIVDRTIALLPAFRNVKAWDLKHGLTGSNNYRPEPKNTPAFDTEIAIANKAGADVFISIHVDGAAPSGVLGECLPGDAKSEALTKRLVAAICAGTGLHNRGIRTVKLYSFEPTRNRAPLRVLLEVGDNAADRAFLLNPAKRGAVAKAIAELLNKELR